MPLPWWFSYLTPLSYEDSCLSSYLAVIISDGPFFACGMNINFVTTFRHPGFTSLLHRKTNCRKPQVRGGLHSYEIIINSDLFTFSSHLSSVWHVGSDLLGFASSSKSLTRFALSWLINDFQMARKLISRLKNTWLLLKKQAWRNFRNIAEQSVSSLEVRRRTIAQQSSFLLEGQNVVETNFVINFMNKTYC